MNILDTINSSADVKTLEIAELKQLCGEIRAFLIESLSQTGGHLASNLGIVELTVAMHKVFNLPDDKIIFDVGHQSYVHKILTGRKAQFHTLRQFGGLSGFPKRSESEYDCFNTGHSSTSISAALGMARARSLKGENYNVAALFGDGALTGGMMFEAMNDAGRNNLPLILILNDNAMSISKNVGAVSKHLRNLRVSPSYFKSKHAIEEFLSQFPVAGKKVASFLRIIKRAIRRGVIPTTLFDDFGFSYIGPINGNDLEAVISCLEYAKEAKKPVVLHVLTKKGKGFVPAEKNPTKYHGLGKFDKLTGETAPPDECYSEHFGKTLCSLADDNKNIIAITGAMPIGTGLYDFSQRFSDRFFDVGIAEEHAVTMAAGMAAGGLIPIVPLYSSFLQRAYDQILHDVCLQNLHVVLPIDRAGIVGADGETHQGIYDIAFLSHMPNMSILSPSSFEMLDEMLDYAINVHNGPIAIRYPRGSAAYPNKTKFIFGKAVKLSEGDSLTIVCTGRMTIRANEVAALLSKDCDIIEVPTIKPLDTALILESVKKTKNIITIEDGVYNGGLGQQIGALLAQKQICGKFHSFAFPDSPIPHGSINELDNEFGLDSQHIVDYINNITED